MFDGDPFVSVSLRAFFFISFIVLSLQGPSFSAPSLKEADSLLQVWKDDTRADSVRLNAIVNYWEKGYFQEHDPDSALRYARSYYELARTVGDKKAIADALHNAGIVYYLRGNYAKAIDRYSRSLSSREEVEDRRGVALTKNNIGVIYRKQGDLDAALEQYGQALEAFREVGDSTGVAASLNNLGNIHRDQGDLEKAIRRFRNSWKISEKLGREGSGAMALNNIGDVLLEKGELDSAMSYCERSLKMDRASGDQEGIAISLISMAEVLKERTAYSEAVERAEEALSIATELENAKQKRDAARILHRLYKKLGRPSKALENYERFIEARDSIQSERNQREVLRQKFRYKYEKERMRDSIRDVEARKLLNARIDAQDARLEKERTRRYALYGGLLFLLLFGGLMIHRFQVTRRQKRVIEAQKSLVEEKQKELTDSIDYAQKIQFALLRSKKLLSSHSPEHFVFFRPQSQVSGDFYWVREHKGYLYIAAVDCTGHGVPGAFMSMLGISQLNEIMNSDEVPTPGYILTELRERVVRELSGKDQEGGAKDGMDAAILRIANSNSNSNSNSKEEGEELAVGNGQLTSVELQFAGAQNPLYVIRKGIAEDPPSVSMESKEGNVGSGRDPNTVKPFKRSQDGIEIKGDPMPVGYDEYAKEAFTTVKLQLQKGDMLYIFSDGYADQFGGPKGKKYRYGPFKELLEGLHGKPLEEQKQDLEKTFEDWKAESQQEQIDDVVVIGVRV